MNLSERAGGHARRRWAPRLRSACLAAATLALVATGMLGEPGAAQAQSNPTNRAEGLKGVWVPEPSNLGDFVKDKAAAIRLGKALFWDIQVGSDGQTACASCHFHAGADNRSRNSVGPSLLRKANAYTANPDTTFQVVGPNGQLDASHFPFVDFHNPNNWGSGMSRFSNDTVSSQGVFNSQFGGVNPGAGNDNWWTIGDPVFNIGGVQSRRVEPRNAPSVINAIFNFRNFWDGRATNLFNGENPFGPFDNSAGVWFTNNGQTSWKSAVRINHASLASLGTGPALSDFEMSARGRNWPEIGRRLVPAKPLARQTVAPSDSVLGDVREGNAVGLRGNYGDMIAQAFHSNLWSNFNENISINGRNYRQIDANFALFFGLATQLYQATLVSDDSPFDRHMAGDQGAMSNEAKWGMSLFYGKGKCGACHGGAEFTNASTRYVMTHGLMSRMRMGNGQGAVYDEGFYNITVTKTLNDIASGENNPVGFPMSLSVLSKFWSTSDFGYYVGLSPNIKPMGSERLAVLGAFKAPTIRNAELTAPYFHNGSVLTLKQLVQFYNRGGNFRVENDADRDPDIQGLGLSEAEQNALVAFIMATTDERVRYKRAPFDHPQLSVPNGHKAWDNGVLITPWWNRGMGEEVWTHLPAVGREGLPHVERNFLEAPLNDGVYTIRAKNSGKVLEVAGVSHESRARVQQWTDLGVANQRWKLTHVGGGWYQVVAQHSMKSLDAGCSSSLGFQIYQWDRGDGNRCQHWHIRMTNEGAFHLVSTTGKVLDIAGPTVNDGAPAILWDWTGGDNQRFWFEPAPHIADGVYALFGKQSGRVLEVAGGSQGNGAPVQVWDWLNLAHQRWRVKHVGGTDEYTITAEHNGKALDVPGCNFNPGTRLIQWDNWANNCQRWRIQSLPDNAFRLVSNGGVVLDLPGSGNGTPGTVFTWHGGDNQRWFMAYLGR